MSGSQLSADELKLARSLVDPERATRERTLSGVVDYVKSVTAMDDMEMLKLWKALYYCMWLADKEPIQSDLSASLCALSTSFKSDELTANYFRMFFRIMLREWFQLDQHRINKFYSLVRVMLRQMFTFAQSKSWSSVRASMIVDILDKEVMSNKPNGLRLHVADIYLAELLTASGGSIPTDQFMIWMQPFLSVMSRREDASVVERVNSMIFIKYIEHPSSDFVNVDPKHLQSAIFNLAAADSTPDFARKRLYDLHKVVAAKTGKPFIDAHDLAEPPQQSFKEEKKKRIFSDEDIIESIPSKKVLKKAKMVKLATSDAVAPTIDIKLKPSKNKVDAMAAISVGSEPTPSLDKDLATTEFVKSKSFIGAKGGYKFQNGPKGVGYYSDSNAGRFKNDRSSSSFKKVKSSSSGKWSESGSSDKLTGTSGMYVHQCMMLLLQLFIDAIVVLTIY